MTFFFFYHLGSLNSKVLNTLKTTQMQTFKITKAAGVGCLSFEAHGSGALSAEKWMTICVPRSRKETSQCPSGVHAWHTTSLSNARKTSAQGLGVSLFCSVYRDLIVFATEWCSFHRLTTFYKHAGWSHLLVKHVNSVCVWGSWREEADQEVVRAATER